MEIRQTPGRLRRRRNVIKYAKSLKPTNLDELKNFFAWGKLPHFTPDGSVKREQQPGGMQTSITNNIREYAAKFKQPKAVHDVAKIIKQIWRDFKIYHLPLNVVARLYMSRTAHDIITSKRIVYLEKKWRELLGMDIRGCNDFALVLIAILRAKNIEAKFLRMNDHSSVLFKLNDKIWWANPSPYGGGKIEIEEFNPNKPEIKKLFEEGQAVIAQDSWDANIRTIDDYVRYLPEKKRDELIRKLTICKKYFI